MSQLKTIHTLLLVMDENSPKVVFVLATGEHSHRVQMNEGKLVASQTLENSIFSPVFSAMELLFSLCHPSSRGKGDS